LPGGEFLGRKIDGKNCSSNINAYSRPSKNVILERGQRKP